MNNPEILSQELSEKQKELILELIDIAILTTIITTYENHCSLEGAQEELLKYRDADVVKKELGL